MKRIPVNEKLPDCGGISIIALCLDANRLAGCVFYHSDTVGFQIGMDDDAEEIYNFATKLYEILNELDSK